MTVERRVIAILARQAVRDPASVTPVMTVEELGLDSLGMVESIFAIEETFDVSVPFNAADPATGQGNPTTVATLVAQVEKLVSERG